MTTAAAPPAPVAPPAARPRPRADWVGPLFRWELVRLARKGQDARARFILAAALLVVLTTFTLVWFSRADLVELFFGTSQSVSLQESAEFGEYFALSFVFAQLAVLVLLTSAYAAGSVAEEKEKRTFEFLLVSDLTNREIVLGKYLGRLTFLLGVLLAGLPVLCLTTLYGGIGYRFLVGAYLITGATVVLHAAVGVASAVATDTYRGALFRSYGLAALHVLVGFVTPFLSPFAYLVWLEKFPDDAAIVFWVATALYVGAELAGAGIAVFLALRWVRKMRAQPVRRPAPKPPARDLRSPSPRSPADAPVELGDADRIEVADGEAVPAAKRVAVAMPAAEPVRRAAPAGPPRYAAPRSPRTRRHGSVRATRTDRPRVDSDDPFLWKERHITGAKQTADDDSIRGVLVAIGVSVGIVVGFLALIALIALAAGGTHFAGGLFALIGAGSLFLYLLTVGSAAAVSVVRERQRLTLESLLSVPVPRRALLWPKWRVAVDRGWWWGLPSAGVGALAFLASDAPLAAVPAAAFVAAAVPFTASYALWLSIRCRTVTRAVLWTLPAIGALVLLLSVAWKVIDPTWGLTVTASLAAAAAGVAVAAGVFWLWSVAAFEREGRT